MWITLPPLERERLPKGSYCWRDKNNLLAWQSTVVAIKRVTGLLREIATASTGKNYTVKDATGEITTFLLELLRVSLFRLLRILFLGYVSIYQPAGQPATPTRFAYAWRHKGRNTGRIVCCFFLILPVLLPPQELPTRDTPYHR